MNGRVGRLCKTETNQGARQPVEHPDMTFFSYAA